MDEQAARAAFDHALETYEQEFGKFFLAIYQQLHAIIASGLAAEITGQ